MCYELVVDEVMLEISILKDGENLVFHRKVVILNLLWIDSVQSDVVKLEIKRWRKLSFSQESSHTKSTMNWQCTKWCFETENKKMEKT